MTPLSLGNKCGYNEVALIIVCVFCSAHPFASDLYLLYAASNVGSMLALLDDPRWWSLRAA